MKKLAYLFVAVLFITTAMQSQAQCICYEQETAWVECHETGQNWQQTVVSFAPSLLLNSTLPIIAGQNYVIGTVTFSQSEIGGPVALTFDIDEEGWMLDPDEMENVKIYAYDIWIDKLVPGKFDKYYETENSFSFIYPWAKYYAIHLDVLRPVPCQ